MTAKSVMNIRAFVPDDAEAIAALLQANVDDPAIRRQYARLHGPTPLRGQNWGRTYVAELRGRTVGVGSVASSARHPRFIQADILVGNEFRRQRIGSRLLDALRTAASDGRPLYGRIVPASPGSREFADYHGFKHFMRSRLWEIDPLASHVRTWCADVGRKDHSFRIEVADVSSELIDAIGAWYRWTHELWNPQGPEEHAEALAQWASVIVPGSGLLARDGDVAIGVGALFKMGSVPNGSGDRLLISPLGVTAPNTAGARAVTEHLLARCLQKAAAMNRPVLIEADDVHADLVDIVTRLDPHLAYEAVFVLENGSGRQAVSDGYVSG